MGDVQTTQSFPSLSRRNTPTPKEALDTEDAYSLLTDEQRPGWQTSFNHELLDTCYKIATEDIAAPGRCSGGAVGLVGDVKFRSAFVSMLYARIREVYPTKCIFYIVRSAYEQRLFATSHDMAKLVYKWMNRANFPADKLVVMNCLQFAMYFYIAADPKKKAFSPIFPADAVFIVDTGVPDVPAEMAAMWGALLSFIRDRRAEAAATTNPDDFRYSIITLSTGLGGCPLWDVPYDDYLSNRSFGTATPRTARPTNTGSQGPREPVSRPALPPVKIKEYTINQAAQMVGFMPLEPLVDRGQIYNLLDKIGKKFQAALGAAGGSGSGPEAQATAQPPPPPPLRILVYGAEENLRDEGVGNFSGNPAFYTVGRPSTLKASQFLLVPAKKWCTRITVEDASFDLHKPLPGLKAIVIDLVIDRSRFDHRRCRVIRGHTSLRTTSELFAACMARGAPGDDDTLRGKPHIFILVDSLDAFNMKYGPDSDETSEDASARRLACVFDRLVGGNPPLRVFNQDLMLLMFYTTMLWPGKSFNSLPIPRITRTFDGQVLQELLKRIRRMGIISYSLNGLTELGKCMVRFIENFRDLSASRAIAAIAHPGEATDLTPAAKRVLLRLVIIIYLGIDRLLYIDPAQLTQLHPDWLQELKGSNAIGAGGQYCDRGRLWLALGLWEWACKTTWRPRSPLYAPPKVVTAIPGCLYVYYQVVDEVKELVDQYEQMLGLADEAATAMPVPILKTERELVTIERELIKAWLPNLAVRDPEAGWVEITGTQTALAPHPSDWTDFSDLSVDESEDDTLCLWAIHFGIVTETRDRGGRYYAADGFTIVSTAAMEEAVTPVLDPVNPSMGELLARLYEAEPESK